MVLLVLTACNDYGINPKVEDQGAAEDTSPPYVTTDTEGSDWPVVCEGVLPLPDTVPIDESCSTEPDTSELTAVVEWSRTDLGAYPEYAQVLTAPLVGQLDDDNGDGVIDRYDTPDVVAVADDGEGNTNDHFGLLGILRGSDGATEATILDLHSGDWGLHPYRYATPALGDLDADGVPELISFFRVVSEGGDPGSPGGDDTSPPSGPPDSGPVADTDTVIGPPPPVGPGDDPEAASPPSDVDPNDLCVPAALHADGTLVWVAEDTQLCAGHMLAVADLDGDGLGEVLAGSAVLAHDGTLLWWMNGQARSYAYAEMGMQPVALDLDADGAPEVLDGRYVYEGDGTERCHIPDGDPDGFPAAADLDGDGRGEFVLVGDGQAHVYEDDCSPAASWVLEGSGNGGPPTIGDFDGDATPEIGVADADDYAVYEADGTLLWAQPVTDASSHATGSSVFDFDGDGRAEVLYADEVALWVFDGATGIVRLDDTSHTSRTLHELPTAADIDGDGEMEILVPNGGGHYGTDETGLYALGSGGAPWLGDRQVWNQHAWSITNVNDDLTMPATYTPNWPFYNTFRSGTLGASAGGALPDAIGELQVCDDPCHDGLVGVQIRLGNAGLAEMRGGVYATLYAEDGGKEKLLGTFRADAATVASGATAAEWDVEVPETSIPEGVLLLRVDDDYGEELVVECDETNNETRLDGVACVE